MQNPIIEKVSYVLYHCPYLSSHFGSTVEGEREKNPDSPFLIELPKHLRDYKDAVAYPPNQSYIGNLDPRNMPPRPWHTLKEESSFTGTFGAILDELTFFGLLKYSDVFNLVLLTKEAGKAIKDRFNNIPSLATVDASFLESEVTEEQILEEVNKGALPLKQGDGFIGCVKDAHPTDPNMTAHVMLENLTAKATAVFSVKDLIHRTGLDPKTVDYIIETSEEACGDVNQRGGGNFAKAIGELCGCSNATGSDTRSFCAAPVHGIVQAGSLIKAGTFNKVLVVAGGALAKLSMNAKKHLEKGLPVLEDCLGGFAILVEKGEEGREGLVLNLDRVGIHKIGSGSTPQAIINALVGEPLKRAGLKYSEVDYYAPELHNPEITESAGAGNVTLSNLKMIAATAVMDKQIAREEIDSFISKHGSSGWAPTQGHIPSGVPALGWLIKWGRDGKIKNSLVIGKGSLFLGRMTNLFDGISILMEYKTLQSKESEDSKAVAKIRIGLTLPGNELGEEELLKGAREAMRLNPMLEVVVFGDGNAPEDKIRGELKSSLEAGEIHGAVTFHYPFSIGTATVGVITSPGKGKKYFLATTTGTAALERSEAIFMNAVKGVAVAKAHGIEKPKVGFLNIEGSLQVKKRFQDLLNRDYSAELVGSIRGEDLLRGNDLLSGDPDVVVCDTLTGNIIIKLLGAYNSGGSFETHGNGYGVGVGDTNYLVGIVSRASSAPVIASALLETASLVRTDLPGIYREEIFQAEKKGLKELLKNPTGESKSSAGGMEENTEGADFEKPKRKPVTKQIEGLEILTLEQAAELLLKQGIYCEPGMGCTGPVLMLAPEDLESAKTILKEKRFI